MNRGLLDTSVVIDPKRLLRASLPDELAISAVTLAELAAGRKARGARSLDLLIAATALSQQLPLYTRNPSDFAGVSELIDARAV